MQSATNATSCSLAPGLSVLQGAWKKRQKAKAAILEDITKRKVAAAAAVPGCRQEDDPDEEEDEEERKEEAPAAASVPQAPLRPPVRLAPRPSGGIQKLQRPGRARAAAAKKGRRGGGGTAKKGRQQGSSVRLLDALGMGHRTSPPKQHQNQNHQGLQQQQQQQQRGGKQRTNSDQLPPKSRPPASAAPMLFAGSRMQQSSLSSTGVARPWFGKGGRQQQHLNQFNHMPSKPIWHQSQPRPPFPLFR